MSRNTEHNSNTERNPNTERFGGPGSSHQDREHPGKNQQPLGHKHGGDPEAPPLPGEPTSTERSHRSGGGGERDTHHTHNPHTKS